MVGVYRVYPKRRRSFFGGLKVNTILILINLVLFIIFGLLISSQLISVDAIAIKPSNILDGKYLWTFSTSMFMHAGFLHLFVNMLSLFFIGSLVERLVGPRRYLWFYLISGLFAGLFFVMFSLVFTADFSTYAVGASGALFGLIGLLMLLTPNLPVYIMFIPIPIKMKYAAPGILILLWIISITANVGIGNTAHLGGLVFGLIYGLYLRKKFPNKIRNLSRHFS